MRTGEKVWSSLDSLPGAGLLLLGGSGFLVLAWTLRGLTVARNPVLYVQLQFASGLLAIILALAVLVRFLGTHGRLPLILACGFVIVGITLVGSSLFSILVSEFDLRDPMTWVIGRTLLALLLVTALVVERRFPKTRNHDHEIIMAVAFVILSTWFLVTAHGRLRADLIVHPGGTFPRLGNLFPAGLFLLAAIGFQRRLRQKTSSFDRSLYYAAVLNVASSLAAAQSANNLDAPFALAEILQFSSYALLLGGALLDHLYLFENVRHLAVSDPLTGLANHSRLVDALEAEIQRSRRTGRSFSVLLFDLDGLKQINDNHGHLAGSSALVRVAAVLRANSRTIDTAARYGGDEFALVLPETEMNAAQVVARRISNHVARDGSFPSITVSAGFSACPQDGEEIETLLSIADQRLYRAKGRIDQKSLGANLVHVD
ncbi:MAG TPA: GGDEF domain-containing protein [Candidatus Acidoferrales bacterium]